MATTRKAQIAEAQGELVTVDFRDAVFTLPANALDTSVDLLEAETELGIVKAILGDEQYATWRAMKPTLRELQEFSNRIAEVGGFGELGN